MTALAKDLQVEIRNVSAEYLRRHLVADNVKCYKGGLIVLDSSGYARPARNTAGEMVIGVCYEQFDNTGSGHAAGGTVGGKTGVLVQSNIDVKLLCAATATQAYVGQPIYALDDQTVTATAGTPAGIVTEFVDATHVWVFIQPYEVTTANGALITAGDAKVTAGNLRLGAISAFATTEPTSWVVMKQGTQPSGAITTSGGIGANATTVQKIIAAGTINNVET